MVTTPRKLQSDEVATVRLFQENTPSVVYITNLAVRQDAFTLDVLEVPQGSGSGFVWDREGHIVTNYHVIRGASDLSGWILCFDKKMGNCVLVHKSSDPAMQFGLQVETPTKERVGPAVAEPGFYGQLSSEGQEQEDSSPSKPEMFFRFSDLVRL